MSSLNQYFEEAPETTGQVYEHIILRMWTLINRVEISQDDDPLVLGSLLPVSRVMMSDAAWHQYRAWKAEHALHSDTAILSCLQDYGFLPGYTVETSHFLLDPDE